LTTIVSIIRKKIEALVPHKAIVWKEPARRRAHTVEVVEFRLAFRNPFRTKGCIASSLDGIVLGGPHAIDAKEDPVRHQEQDEG